MPTFDITVLTNGTANGANTYALENPHDGTPPSFDEELRVSIRLTRATGIFTGTASKITSADFSLAEDDLAANATTINPELNNIYTSAPGNSLYNLVFGATRNESVTVLSETPTDTALTDVTPLHTVLNQIAANGGDDYATELNILRERLATNDSENRWVQNDGGGPGYYNVPKVGDVFVFYAKYTVTVTSKYALDGVGEGATITYWDGTQNATAIASNLTDGTTSVEKTFKIVATVVVDGA
jgi:hypothetical protein